MYVHACVFASTDARLAPARMAFATTLMLPCWTYKTWPCMPPDAHHGLARRYLSEAARTPQSLHVVYINTSLYTKVGV